MEVKILSKETIKPYSSTPQHLKNYKLSLLDQLAPPIYVPVILFYTSTPSFAEKSNRLKKSLSETLTLYYPLAGRIKNSYSIDCNDQGASYIEARIPGEMSMILQDPEVTQLEKLLPFNPQEMSSVEEILGAQVNHFDCGGMAISICIWHQIADASAAASIATTWARIASGKAATNFEGIIYDCTSIFPPHNTEGILWNKTTEKDFLRNIMLKRFVFDHSKLAALREKVGNKSSVDHLGNLSRVETVAAVIWGVVLDLVREKEETTNVNAGILVGLRKRMVPPLPELSLGNITLGSISTTNCFKNESQIDYNNLARKIHQSIEIVNDDYVRKIFEGGQYIEIMKDLMSNPNRMKVFGFSSWCRFPFYKTDFGWGNPIWVATTLKFNETAIFIDTKDGEGIEAWVTLPKEDMVKFQQNHDICSYASFSSIV
ncbi:HXXXD-type acyl-transferase family protein [Euphorbia peplus]|nr:HXXXD-type acyl-transferase family protein [Euphorbia peplus]